MPFFLSKTCLSRSKNEQLFTTYTRQTSHKLLCILIYFYKSFLNWLKCTIIHTYLLLSCLGKSTTTTKKHYIFLIELQLIMFTNTCLLYMYIHKLTFDAKAHSRFIINYSHYRTSARNTYKCKYTNIHTDIFNSLMSCFVIF